MNSSYAILPIILLLIAFRIWRTGGRERPISVQRLWILPVIFTVPIVMGLMAQPIPLTMLTIDALAVVFVLGFGAGWLRGRTTHISVDAETGGLKAKTTPIALVFIAALFLIRMTARDWLNAHADEWGIDPIAIVDGFMLFGLGVILGWRIEMILRCLRLQKSAAAAEETQ